MADEATTGRERVAALRRRRTEAGLIRLQEWIRVEDLDAAREALRPFLEAAAAVSSQTRPVRPQKPKPHRAKKPRNRQARLLDLVDVPEPRMIGIRFTTTPPAAVREGLKADGMVWDREAAFWRFTDRRARTFAHHLRQYGIKPVHEPQGAS